MSSQKMKKIFFDMWSMYISTTMKYFEVGGVGNWELERVVSYVYYIEPSFVGLRNGRSGNKAGWMGEQDSMAPSKKKAPNFNQ